MKEDLAEQVTYFLIPDASGETVARVAEIIANYHSADAAPIPASDLSPLLKQILAMDAADADGDAEIWAMELRNELTLLIEKHPHLMPEPDEDDGGDPRTPSFGVAP